MPKGDKREHNSVPRFHTVWTQNRHGPGAFGCAYRSLKSDHIGDAAGVGTRRLVQPLWVTAVTGTVCSDIKR